MSKKQYETEDDESTTVGYIQDGHTFERTFATGEEAFRFLDALCIAQGTPPTHRDWMKHATILTPAQERAHRKKYPPAKVQ